MRLAELCVLYGLVGLGSAVAVALRRSGGGFRVVDALLLLGLWPLYGPFLLARFSDRVGVGSAGEVAFVAALRRASGTPLAALLPDERTVQLLARRLQVAADKVAEIDGLLGQREFCPERASRRLTELQKRAASECAQSTARMRLQNIRRLRRLRDRFARELDEVAELLEQLHTQAEVVRLAGAPDEGTRELVDEIVSRVEGLDRMLDDDPCALSAD